MEEDWRCLEFENVFLYRSGGNYSVEADEKHGDVIVCRLLHAGWKVLRKFRGAETRTTAGIPLCGERLMS